MALIGVFTCRTCGWRGSVNSDPEVVTMKDSCPQDGCEGQMNGEYTVTGTY